MLEYCTRLDLHPPAPEAASVFRDSLLATAKEWVDEGLERSGVKGGLTWGESVMLEGNHELTSSCSSLGSQTLDRLVWTRPHEIDPTLRWRSTLIFAGISPTRVVLDLTIELVSTAFVARTLPATQVRPPRVVRKILERFSAYEEPPGALLRVHDIDEAGVEARLVPELESRTRSYPVIVVSPPAARPDVYALPPDRIQRDVAGLARVYRITLPATYRLSRIVGGVRSCFDGGIRLYWPGFDREAFPYTHTLLLGEDIAFSPRRAQERIFRIVRENATLRFTQSAEVLELQSGIWAAEDAARASRIESLERRLAETNAAERAVRSELGRKLESEAQRSSELGSLLYSLRKDSSTLRRLLKEFAEQLRSTQRENDDIKRSSRELGRIYIQQGLVETPPATIYEAASRAQATCPNLLITSRAMDIARRSEIADPDKVYLILRVADEVAGKLAAGNTFGHHWGEEIVQKAGERGGFNIAFKPHLSTTAKGKSFRREYECTYIWEGRVVKKVIEPHILVQRHGNAQEAARIYLDWDEVARKIVISRIGLHPKNLAS